MTPLRIALKHVVVATLISILFEKSIMVAATNTTIPLLPRDLISITVFDELDLSVERRLDNTGRVSLPLLGLVKLGGLTIPQSEDAIEKLYVERDLLKRPEVSVSVKEHYLREVSVVGEVNSPGVVRFPLATESMGILAIISRAGGIKTTGRDNAVRVTRRDNEGAEEVFVVDVNALLKGKGREDEFVILPDDVIFVDERFL